MIDEKKLTEQLQMCVNASDNSNFTNGLLSAIDVVNQQTKIGGWIPCSERLPEESLNSVVGWDEYRQRCCFVQYLGGRWILGNDTDSVKITHWQPVPSAPYEVKPDEQMD